MSKKRNSEFEHRRYTPVSSGVAIIGRRSAPSKLHNYHAARGDQQRLSSSSSQQHQSQNQPNGGDKTVTRKLGFVEKLLTSYGFIQVIDDQAEANHQQQQQQQQHHQSQNRLFFHYSQVVGTTTDLRVQDEVEFEIMTDRDNRKVATRISRLKKGTINFESFSPERVNGEVASPPQGAHPGSLSYQAVGEYFFLPFAAADISSHCQLYKGDKVSFFIATDKRNRSMCARKVTLVERASNPNPAGSRCQGRVSSMKDSFGFIKRSDVAGEIFFHYSQVSADVPDLREGNDVEFAIEQRKDKQVAVSITLLPEGSVVFDDVSKCQYNGIIRQLAGKKATTHDRGDRYHHHHHDQQQGQPGQIEAFLGGDEDDDEVILPYAKTDRDGNAYTIQQGDHVTFYLATDRRNGQKRAVGVQLDIEKTAEEKGEERECGVVAAVKVLEGFGFIKCQSRDSRMFFHCSELIDAAHRIKMSDEVQFTVLPDQMAESKRLHATRISILPKGSVTFQTVSKATYQATIGPDGASLIYETDELKEQLGTVRLPDDVKKHVNVGDVVTFRVLESKRTGDRSATELSVVESESAKTGVLLRGTVILKKDSYGFIESEDHTRETFFHYSELSCKPEELETGAAVQYYEALKENKVCGTNVILLDAETDLTVDEVIEEHVYHGTVKNELKSGTVNYGGLISGEHGDIRFTSSSLADRKNLQVGDSVCYQHGVHTSGAKRAVNVQAKRKMQESLIDSIKGDYGFIVFEDGEETKNLFFHASNLIETQISELGAGDTVSFRFFKLNLLN
jgi:cold shock CspA family protein